ncbi:MAG TPA: 5-formyltetrahydrofolate cyclo-ligase [Clostridiales bacterium]|jgi:5-formyltetrahydrofolate cyclo-ligase|nr:5-formyltetrahydrofolate cyclo-ligase [Clostridiales bacterium]
MHDDIRREKRRLRKEYRAAHAELNPEYIAESDRGIFENLSKLPEFKSARAIFTYYSIQNEPDTHRIIELALQMGKIVTLPLIRGNGIMDAAIIRSFEDIGAGAFEIPAPAVDAELLSPEKIDFAIIPALSFDREGFRVGQGGGYYDRFLKDARYFAVGITRAKFFVERLPREDHDVPVRCVVTENEIARLR